MATTPTFGKMARRRGLVSGLWASWKVIRSHEERLRKEAGKWQGYSRYFSTSYFCIPIFYDEKDIFLFGFSFRMSRIIQLQLLQHQWWGIDLDYYDVEWFVLETNRDYSVIFDVAPKYFIWTLLLIMKATPFLLRDSCPWK